MGLPVPVVGGIAAAAAIVAKAMAATKEMIDLWNSIVKNVV